MRHEHLLLSEAESSAVVDEINAWCRRTGTNYLKLVTAARVAPSTRSAVRTRRRRLTVDTAAKIRSAMKANPHGIARGEHKARVRLAAKEAVERQRAKRRSDFPAVLVAVDRSLCPRCGARRDVGCEHPRRF